VTDNFFDFSNDHLGDAGSNNMQNHDQDHDSLKAAAQPEDTKLYQ
jgi:hypothetical protein